MYFNASFFYFLPFYARFRDFFSVFRVVCCISLSLLRVSNPHMPTVGSGALLAILTDCQQPTHKNTQMMIMIAPAEGVDPSQGRAGRGMRG